MTAPNALDAPKLAQMFHEAYERLAPQFGYETRKASAKPWAEVPENNRKLMTAVCAEILQHIATLAEIAAPSQQSALQQKPHNYLSDLLSELNSSEYRAQYLTACAADSSEALTVGIKDMERYFALELLQARLEEAEKRAHNWFGPYGDSWDKDTLNIHKEGCRDCIALADLRAQISVAKEPTK